MKFYGEIGYVDSNGDSVETFPGSGVWVDNIIERPAYGDVERNARQLQANTERINDDLRVNNTISIVADAYLSEFYFAIRYVVWRGVRWKVTDVTVGRPRLILSLGGVYNGPTPVGTAITP